MTRRRQDSAWVAEPGQALTREQYNAGIAEAMAEAVLQDRVLDEAHLLGWRWYHTHDSRRSPAGFPDLVLWHPTRQLVKFRELKRQRENLRRDQARVLAELAASGADVGVWRPSDLLDGTIGRELAPDGSRSPWAGASTPRTGRGA